jgi:hypothetical protein
MNETLLATSASHLGQLQQDAREVFAPYQAGFEAGKVMSREGAPLGEMQQVADAVCDRLAVPREEAVSDWEYNAGRNMGLPAEAVRVRRAGDMAEMAEGFGYDPDLQDGELKDVTATMIDDLRRVRAEDFRSDRQAAPTYRVRETRMNDGRTRQVLLESALRELGGRNGTGTGLTAPELAALQQATGLEITAVNKHGMDNALGKPAPIVEPRPVAASQPPAAAEQGPRSSIYENLPRAVLVNGRAVQVIGVAPGVGSRGAYRLKNGQTILR